MTYTNNTLGNFIDTISEKYKEQEAIIFPEKKAHYTYGNFKEMYSNIAKFLLSLGIKKGDHIAIWALNYPEWIALEIAVAKIGAVLVCLNSGYNKKELEYTLNHSDSTTLFLSKGFKDINFLEILLGICPELPFSKKGHLNSSKLPKLKNIIFIDDSQDCIENLSENIYFFADLLNYSKNITDSHLAEIDRTLKSEEVINIQYTSGTTGHPKAVMLTHFSILNNAIALGERFQYSKDDKLLICLPLFHVMGCILSSLVCLIYGATIVLIKRFRPSTVMSLVECEKCTALNAVPAMFQFILNNSNFNNYDLSSLKKGMIAGSFCANHLLTEIIKKMNMYELAVVYGQTEALAITATPLIADFEKQTNTAGTSLPGVSIKIIDLVTGEELPNGMEGELCTKSPYLLKGYYKDEEATKKALDSEGWLHTGDLAIKDNHNFIIITERVKDIIIRGGENISPIEIELLLNSYESIKDSSIVGVPDKNLGEEVCSFIILNEGYHLEPNEIRYYISENLAKYKIPKYVEIIEEFPTTASGKIKKFLLKDYAIKKYNLS